MPANRTQPWLVTILGLAIGAGGIGILWATGVEFPFPVPPGMIILLAGALFVGLAPWRWAPGIGVLLGLFVIVGFALSPTGVPNLIGVAGAGTAAGQAIQLVGVATALVAGLLAVRANYRGSTHAVSENE